MVYGIIKLINFAHGDIYMVGAYVGFYAVTMTKMSIIPALIISMVVTGLLGILVEKIAYKPLRKAPRISLLITAIGVSFSLNIQVCILFHQHQELFQMLLIPYL